MSNNAGSANSVAIEIRDDLFHQVEISDGRMAHDMIARIERAGSFR
jgi:hypothetical protein